MRRVVVMLSLWCSMAVPAQAARTVSVDQPLTIRLELNQPTTIAYPERIMSVTIGWDKDTINANNNGPYLYLLPRRLDETGQLTGRIFVVGESGTLYAGTYRVASPSDDVVTLVRPVTATPTKTVALAPEGVLRALRTGTPLPGQQPAVVPAPTLPDSRLTLLEASSLTIGTWTGVTLALVNASPQTLLLDERLGINDAVHPEVVALTRLVWPPRYRVLLVTISDPQVAPGMEVRVWAVLERQP